MAAGLGAGLTVAGRQGAGGEALLQAATPLAMGAEAATTRKMGCQGRQGLQGQPTREKTEVGHQVTKKRTKKVEGRRGSRAPHRVTGGFLEGSATPRPYRENRLPDLGPGLGRATRPTATATAVNCGPAVLAVGATAKAGLVGRAAAAIKIAITTTETTDETLLLVVGKSR